jgi:5-methylcytosine-specific restriction protein A
MPTAAPRVCNRCHQPTPTGHACPCKPKPFAGSTNPAGGRKWIRYRNAWLRAYPICNHPNCRKLATTVDHITPIAEGSRQYDHANMQSLCDDHHKAKTTTDARRGKTRARSSSVPRPPVKDNPA